MLTMAKGKGLSAATKDAKTLSPQELESPSSPQRSAFGDHSSAGRELQSSPDLPDSPTAIAESPTGAARTAYQQEGLSKNEYRVMRAFLLSS